MIGTGGSTRPKSVPMGPQGLSIPMPKVSARKVNFSHNYEYMAVKLPIIQKMGLNLVHFGASHLKCYNLYIGKNNIH